MLSVSKEPVKNYTQLEVWINGIAITKEVYLLTKKFPKEEVYALSSQIKRSAVSIPANIAEGWGRGSTNHYLHFLKISRGSLFELETLLSIALELEYVQNETKGKIESLLLSEHKMLNGLISKLSSKKT